MKTLVVLLTLAAVTTASPTVFPKDDETIKHINKLDENTLLNRQKKSPLEELTDRNIEDGLTKDNINQAEERHSGLKNPIMIKKKFGIHHLRNSDNLEERESKKECETPVKVSVCNDEIQKPSKIMKPATSARSDIITSENEMENSIQMAKEAVENLHRDLLNIEKKSQIAHSRSDTELDSELHSNIEIARKALENIHHSFGDLESMNLKRESTTDEDGLKETFSEVERLAQWKEVMENAQREMEIARNIEDTFKTEGLKKDGIENEDTVKEQLRSDTDASETKDFMKDMKSVQNLEKTNDQTMESEKQRSDVESTHMMQTQTNNEDLKKESQLKMVTDMEIPAPSLRATQENNAGFTMKSNEAMDFNKQMQERREPLNTLWTQEKSSDDGKQKLFDTLSMRLSENDGKRHEALKSVETKKQMIENHETHMTPDMHTQEQMSFKMSPTNMMQQQNLNMHQQHSSHMPMLVHDHHMPKQFGSVGMNFDQNNVNVFQNQDNSMMEMNQQQTAEDPFFMRWAAEEQRNAMGVPSGGMNLKTDFRAAQMDDLHMDPVSQFEMAGNDDLSALGTSVQDHDHMHFMHHAHMDGSMQPSMRMNMMTNMRPTHEYNALQWANQGLARSSYGSASAAASSGSSGDGLGSSGAVGVFPNAKVGGCAIPILVSCSPSLATGTLAKAQPQPSYSSGYRSGDNMVYYMKRDAKEDDLPILKVQRTHTPYNHKTELVLEKTHE